MNASGRLASSQTSDKMVEIKENGNIVYMIAHGKLDDKDYDRMLPLIRQKIDKHDNIRWYFEMRDFKGWTASAFWRDVKFDLKNMDHLEKVAIVGENDWQKWMTKAMKPFTDAEIKYFDEKNAGEAGAWIKQ